MKVQRRSEQIDIFYFWRKNADTGNLIFDKNGLSLTGGFRTEKSQKLVVVFRYYTISDLRKFGIFEYRYIRIFPDSNFPDLRNIRIFQL